MTLRSHGWARESASWRRASASWRRAPSAAYPSKGWTRIGGLWRRIGDDPHDTGSNPSRQFPTSQAAWAAAFPTLPVPIAIIPCQDTSSPIQETVADKDLTENQALLYAQAGDPLGRLSLGFDTTSVNEWAGMADSTFGDVAVGGHRFVYFRFAHPATAAARTFLGKGDSAVNTRWGCRITSAGLLNFRVGDGPNSIDLNTVNSYADGAYYDCLMGIDSTADVGRVITLTENVSVGLGAGLISTINTVGIAPTAAFRLGACLGVAAIVGMRLSYVAMFDDVLTQAHLTTITTPI